MSSRETRRRPTSPRPRAPSSEIQPQSPLDLPHRRRQTRDRATGIAVDERVRLREVGAVGDVVDLESKLQRQILSEGESLGEIQIDVEEVGPGQTVSLRVSEGVI